MEADKIKVMLVSEGVGNDPASWNDFVNRIVPMINKRPGWKGQGILYGALPVGVLIGQGERIHTFAEMLLSYEGIETHGLGHSNGTDVILGGWAAANQPPIKTLHLLCGACDADFESNGLNTGLKAGAIGDVYVYVATADSAMKIENTLAGKVDFGLPLGHQSLGLSGPKNVDASVIDRVHVIDWTGYDHSTCWDDAHFDGTFEQVMVNAEAGGTGREALGMAAGTAVHTTITPDLTPREQGLQAT